MTAIVTGLGKTDDWEARMKALGLLQAVVLGDGMEYESFPGLLRGIHDLLIAQIADLRSTLCKEACRCFIHHFPSFFCTLVIVAHALLYCEGLLLFSLGVWDTPSRGPRSLSSPL